MISLQQPSNHPRVIVADDHEWIRSILSDVVRQTLPEADVAEAVDGLEALNACQQGCSFLVTNHAMPRMNGMELIREMRKQIPHLPIAMVSIHPSAEVDAMEAGANWFIIKEQIMERLPRLLLRYAMQGKVEPVASPEPAPARYPLKLSSG